MKIIMKYGKEGYPLAVDPSWDVSIIRKTVMPLIADPVSSIEHALSEGVNADRLEFEAIGKRSACILVCDVTRPVPNKLILAPILKRLLRAGLQKKNIKLLIATGLHRPNTGSELAELIGDSWVLEDFAIENHFAEKDTDHMDLGKTKSGTPVKIDRRFVEADVKIVTGLVEPHFMAGFSGGRKVVAPGIAHAETIRTFHSHRFMAHEKTENCLLEGNKLHLEQLEIIKYLGDVLAVNTVIDEDRNLSFVNYGEIITSHLEAVNFVKRYATKKVSRKFDIIVTSAAGYPLDQTYYQTVKGMISPMHALAENGNMIVMSSCAEGLGSDDFIQSQKRLAKVGGDAFLSEISKRKLARNDEWQTQMQLKASKKINISLYTEGLSTVEKNLTGVEVIDNVEKKIKDLLRSKEKKSIAVIPEGPYIVPAYEAAENETEGRV